jgi:hypothetical protein
MDIIFNGMHDCQEASDSLLAIMHVLQERYHIAQFREMRLSVTLVDELGADVELVDTKTDQAYRVFEVYRESHGQARNIRHPALRLVVDNK